MNTELKTIRTRFPFFERHPDVAYLDSAASSLTPRSVIEAVGDYYRDGGVNVHRGIYRLSEKATSQYEDARDRVAGFIGASSSAEIVFTRSATEALNLVAAGWGRHAIHAGERILVSAMEHHSNLVPWQRLAEAIGAKLDIIPLAPDGCLDMEAFDHLLDERVRLVSVTHISNVLGVLNPIRELAGKAHAVGALLAVDAAQSLPHIPVDVGELDCDFLAFSGHKMFGPSGIGVLYARRHHLERMQPWQSGGEMIAAVEYEHATYAEPPARFEAGTPNIAGAIGLHAAMDEIALFGFDDIRNHTERLVERAIALLGELAFVDIIGSPSLCGGLISFVVEGVHPHDLAQFADEDDVAIRAGTLCAQPLVHALGYPAVARMSVHAYNTEDELDRLIACIRRARAFFE